MMQKGYAWQMEEAGKPLVRKEFDLPSPVSAELLVEVSGCGVCHTDLSYYFDGVRPNHPLPLILGHEISGLVLEAGEGAESWVGKKVIIPAVIPCGKCGLCLRGRGTICRSQKMPGNDIQGGFASHVRVPEYGLCEVDETKLEAAGLTLADVSVIADAVTTPYQAAVRSGIGKGDLAVVIGAGGIGGYAVQICAALGASVVAIDIDASRLESVRQNGAALALDAREVEGREFKKRILEFAENQGLPAQEWYLFECSGSVAGQKTAFGLLTHGGTLCVVGFTMDRFELRLSNLMAFDARALGNWGCAPELYPAALELVMNGSVAVAPFVEQYPLDSIQNIFNAAQRHELTKRAVLVP
ncbi:MAG: 6-hydroxycyclohex-1-ene-1-carbonyl-CoA dehydrogenase [SAR324 cluster bacterium]|jgi:6-hydroxycyclohex-1-ene-1-carbonyl-CoA dehydrogenase|nr:6-hydroxycyclohex-1-ene-1-carbonyl-CoA dehydrogenase [Deltaproteobacteria bacterium]MDP6091903.1 6-hydroxycyclohex-1-ene-1-carbonyl-CoA dehydrogenase [SAR324 cluster bacterium]MDP6246673.1 6-hydroxycyclohex-1-ene-1-carbonyl-CoA dehydrogenase [SAR324 cluster bacterium]MDP7332695.1 6-hydroxycyclohex-1-ene-1-carbonyl-CoA dehydrogenase [SAR324 cluster bacterium]MDP7502100.1 6-hydroxycyclohex-1-ene-1-carbonyl-CoA dehydrogenase [SAR324 cluster bacterium]|tara:strand:+ start:401 stop:1468 length:1068 start_codon:yes stop_codon:yes gene_type:complete